jgi:hypothetical protein
LAAWYRRFVKEKVVNVSNPIEVTEVASTAGFLCQPDPSLVKLAVEHGSPIAFLVLLCWFFQVLTQFIKTCKEG